MKSTRCEEVIVQLVVRTYDETNRPVGERLLGQPNGSGGLVPVKVFRNTETRDFWAWVDTQVAALERAEKAVPTPAPVLPVKKRGRG